MTGPEKFAMSIVHFFLFRRQKIDILNEAGIFWEGYFFFIQLHSVLNRCMDTVDQDKLFHCKTILLQTIHALTIKMEVSEL